MNTLKGKDEEAQELIKNLQVFEIVCSKINNCFVPKVIITNQTLPTSLIIYFPNYYQIMLFKYLNINV